MQDNQQQEIKEMVEYLRVSPEFAKALVTVRDAPNMRGKLEGFNRERKLIEQGDPEAVKKQHEAGRLTARERVNKLLDPGSFFEIGLWHRPHGTGFDIGEEAGSTDGVVVGYGLVNERPVCVWAQDATILGGTVGTTHARKVSVIMEAAINARIPLIGIFDSAGVRAHDAIQYPDHVSAWAFFQTMASGVIPKISLVMGQCTGELNIIAGLGDFTFMVRNTSYMHLAPPPSGIDSQTLGDPWNVHAKVSGCCDVIADNEEDCLLKCRQLLSYLPSNNMEKPPIIDMGDNPNRRDEELLELVPVDVSKPYSMYKLISLLVDNGEFFEIRRYWTRNLITGFARLDGQAVGILANNPQDKGGCLNLDAADKISHFVRFGDAFNIPLIWLVDTPAFLPAIDEESRGLIRHGAGMITANCEATVPKITVAVRKHYGGGRWAMPRAIYNDFYVVWPAFEEASLGVAGAVRVLYGRELRDIADETQRKEYERKRVRELEWSQLVHLRENPQTIIDPRDTRPFLIGALKWLKNRKMDYPPRKHENIRL